MPKHLGSLFQDFYHLRLSKSSEIKKYNQMSNKYLEPSNLKVYFVLSHFEKCRNLLVKLLCNCPK